MDTAREPEWERYSAMMERLREFGLPDDLWREVDYAVMGILTLERGKVLGNLVIGIYSEDSFPAVSDAITTRGAQPVEIDECDHRFDARMAIFLKDTAPEVSLKFEEVARAQLEYDLGNSEALDAIRQEETA